MARQIPVLATKSDHHSSIPGTHTVEGISQVPQVILCCHVYAMVCVHRYVYQYTLTQIKDRE